MAFEIKVPRFGWTMETGVFIAWIKSEGESVAEGDPLFTLEGDKVTEDGIAGDSGTLRIASDAPSPGEEVDVGRVIGHLVAEGEEVPSVAPVRSSAPAISPRAARRAAELGVEWRTLGGSGKTGRIREQDILRAADSRKGPEPTEISSTSSRKIIAEHMASSSRQAAAVTLMTTVAAEAIVDAVARARSRAVAEESPGYTDFLVGIVGGALRAHPAVNAHWTKGDVALQDGVHIGIAVDAHDKLLAPVVQNADEGGLCTILRETRDAVERARAGKLRISDLGTGTFTISNLGMYGVDAFTPIIQEPQIAILGVGRIRDEPVVRDGAVVAGKVLALSLTFDHRAIDGAPAARFLDSIRRGIEQPSLRFPEDVS